MFSYISVVMVENVGCCTGGRGEGEEVKQEKAKKKKKNSLLKLGRIASRHNLFRMKPGQ